MNLRLILLKLSTCTVGGCLCVTLLYVAADDRQYAQYAREMVVAAGVGALYGLLAGIAWAIEHSARRRFILWLVVGLALGFGITVLQESGIPILMFTVAGAFIGTVSALARVGAFRNK